MLFDHGHGVMIQESGLVGVSLPWHEDDARWAPYISSEATQLVRGHDLELLRDSASTTREILVATVRDQTGPIGLVVVSGRSKFRAPNLSRPAVTLTPTAIISGALRYLSAKKKTDQDEPLSSAVTVIAACGFSRI